MTERKPSKTKLKRRSRELQTLGESLIGLDAAQLERLPIGDALKEAIDKARRIRSHGALRRQKQLIGKLMRDVDPGPLEAALAELSAESDTAKHAFADAEHWRDRVLREGGTAVAAFEQATATASPELEHLVESLRHAVSDKDVRRLRRQVFRNIHRTLLDALHSDRLPR